MQIQRLQSYVCVDFGIDAEAAGWQSRSPSERGPPVEQSRRGLVGGRRDLLGWRWSAVQPIDEAGQVENLSGDWSMAA
jgi:hypothetical protein